MLKQLSISILTTARSDFGLLKRVISRATEFFHVDLLIAGSHFLSSRGSTVHEIEGEFGSTPNLTLVRFDAMLDGNSYMDHVETIANTQLLASRWFAEHPCDLLLFLGDRWELWGVTLPAFLHRVPLAHISGGEVTEGVIDDSIRHSHSKLAALHFAATDRYAMNLSRMGEEDWRISVVGECGLDQIHDSEFATTEEVMARFDVDLSKDTFLVTFHPSTLDLDTPVVYQIDALLQALLPFADRQLVFTAPGMEEGSRDIIESVRAFVAEHPATRFVDHFGSRNYLAVMRSAKVVVGNSSSGVVEASSFGVPAVNVGQRQKNRMAADSVQHVGYDPKAIGLAVERALSADFQRYARTCLNPYDPFRDGKNSERIVKALINSLTRLPREHLLVKKFESEINSNLWNKLLSGEYPQ